MAPTPEEGQHAAEHKAAALHNVGWEKGAGATVWARAVQDILGLHESARERFTADTDLESWERLHGTALMLAVAIDQVLAFERRVRKLTGDAELAEARERFDARVGPDAESLRDLVAHLDAYAVGEGWRQIGKQSPAISDKYLAQLVYWGDGGGTVFDVGGERMYLRTAASAATELAQVVERVRVKHLKLAEEEANAAFRRRWGVPDDPNG